MEASLSNIPPRGRKRSIATVEEVSTTDATITGPAGYTTFSAARDGMQSIKESMEIRRARVSKTGGLGVASNAQGKNGPGLTQSVAGSSKPSLGRSISNDKSSASSRGIPIPQPSLFYDPVVDSSFDCAAAGPSSVNTGSRTTGQAGAPLPFGRPPIGTRQRSGGGTLFPSAYGVEINQAQAKQAGDGQAAMNGRLQSKFVGMPQPAQMTRNALETKPNQAGTYGLLPPVSIAKPSTDSQPQASLVQKYQEIKPARPGKRAAASPIAASGSLRTEKRAKSTHAGLNAAALFGGDPIISYAQLAPVQLSNATQANIARESQVRTLARNRTTEEKKREAASTAQEEANEQWRMKYTKAWPSFVFHFDANVGEGAGKAAREKHRKLGGRVDEFYSSKVTHIITLKDPAKATAPPATATTSSSAAQGRKPQPLAASIGLAHITRNGPDAVTMKTTAATVPCMDLGARGKSLMSPFKGSGMANVAAPITAESGVSELAMKAHLAGKKVWTLAKLNVIFDQLFKQDDAQPTEARDNNLTFLLEDEKLHGTRERDATARRPDWYYFPKNSGYLLVEDATGEHCPIMVKLYDTSANSSNAWPRMYETFLKPSEGALRAAVSPNSARQRAMSLYVDRVPFRGEKPPVSTTFGGTGLMERAIGGNLHRTDSLANLKNRAQADATKALREEALVPYQGASGNSVNLTSTVASTMAAMSGAKQAQQDKLGVPGAGIGQTKQLAQMSKRIQVSKRVELLKGNIAPKALEQAKIDALRDNGRCGGLIAKSADLDAESDLEVIHDVGIPAYEAVLGSLGTASTSSEEGISSGTSSAGSVSGAFRAGRMDLYVRETVLEILKKARAPAEIDPEDAEKLRKARRRGIHLEDTKGYAVNPEPKSGYCENCRMKFDEFQQHIRSRRHRRFATDDYNFAALDGMLDMLERPLPLVRDPKLVF